MVNIRGQVVGINSAIMTPTGNYVGYGFAIPIDLAGRVMEDLIEFGRVRRAWLGVSIEVVAPVDAEQYNLPYDYLEKTRRLKVGVVDITMLENSIRDELNRTAPRVMGVLRPLRVVIENYPEESVEMFEAVNNPEDPSMGTRQVPFSRVIYIEQDDFLEEPPKKFFRLAPGREVRLKHAYYITCREVVKDEETGEIRELLCTYDPESRGGSTPDGRKVKATIHWVSAAHAVEAGVRLYDHLFSEAELPEEKRGTTFLNFLNPNSLETLESCQVEPGLREAAPGSR